VRDTHGDDPEFAQGNRSPPKDGFIGVHVWVDRSRTSRDFALTSIAFGGRDFPRFTQCAFACFPHDTGRMHLKYDATYHTVFCPHGKTTWAEQLADMIIPADDTRCNSGASPNSFDFMWPTASCKCARRDSSTQDAWRQGEDAQVHQFVAGDRPGSMRNASPEFETEFMDCNPGDSKLRLLGNSRTSEISPPGRGPRVFSIFPRLQHRGR